MEKRKLFEIEQIKFEISGFTNFYSEFLRYLNDIKNEIEKNLNKSNKNVKFLLFVGNFPLEICYDYMKKQRNEEFIKELNNFLKVIKILLNSNKNIHLIFYWTHSSDSIACNSLETIFGKEVIDHTKTKILIFNKIYKTNMRNLINQLKMIFSFNLTPDEITSLVDSVDGNLKKLENVMISLYNKNKFIKKQNVSNIHNSMCNVEHYYDNNSKNSRVSQFTPSVSQVNDFFQKNNNFQFSQLDSGRNDNKSYFYVFKEEPKIELFHVIGKILYNKRIDPVTNEPRAMKKREMSQTPMPKSYFNLKELIDNVPCDYTQFNELLIENSFDKFYDIGELARALDTFSLTDTFNLFKYGTKEYIYEDQFNSIEYYKTYLNASACMIENKSQYEKVFMNNKKEGINNFSCRNAIYKKLSYYKRWLHNLRIKELYFQFIKKNASQYNFRGFILDLKYIIYERLKLKNKSLNFKKFTQHFDKIFESDNFKEIENLINTSNIDDINLCDKNLSVISIKEADENYEDLWDSDQLQQIINNNIDFESDNESLIFDD